MNKRLNETMTALFLLGIVATSTVTPSTYAVGISEKAETVEITNEIYPVSIQPKVEELQIEKILVMKQIAENQEQIRQQELLRQKELERKELAAIKNDKEVFLKIVRQKDVTKINLTTPSGLVADDIEKILEGTKLAGLGKAFANAEKQYGVNAYYLIAHAAWESGWGESRLAKNKNNLFGFSAYDHDAYGSATRFKTKADCIATVAKFISTNYLNESGLHYNGPTLKGMNKKYASDDSWANGIASIIKSLAVKSIEA